MLKKQFPKKGFIFIAIDLKQDMSMPQCTLMKTNSDLKIVDTLEMNSFKEEVSKLESWIENPNDYKFLGSSYNHFATFTQLLDKHSKLISKDFIRIVKSRFWNLHSEILYQLKCPNHFSIEKLVQLYGLTSVSHKFSYMQDCLHLHMLAVAYLTGKLTHCLIKDGYLKHLDDRYRLMSVEKKMEEMMKLGYTLQFESNVTDGFKIQAQKPSGENVVGYGKSVNEVLAGLCVNSFVND